MLSQQRNCVSHRNCGDLQSKLRGSPGAPSANASATFHMGGVPRKTMLPQQARLDLVVNASVINYIARLDPLLQVTRRPLRYPGQTSPYRSTLLLRTNLLDRFARAKMSSSTSGQWVARYHSLYLCRFVRCKHRTALIAGPRSMEMTSWTNLRPPSLMVAKGRPVQFNK